MFWVSGRCFKGVAASFWPAVAAAAVLRVSTLRRPSGHISPDAATSRVPAVAAVANSNFEDIAASLVPAVARTLQCADSAKIALPLSSGAGA